MVARHLTTNGEYCISPCTSDRATYNWCYKAGGSWGNCSIDVGYDINGAECTDSCGYGKVSYTWCHIKQSPFWNHCGVITETAATEFTYLGSKCLSPCELDVKTLHNTCYDATNVKRECSYAYGVATDNMICTTTCDTNQIASEKSWYSCRTIEGVWKKCSKFETDQAFYNGHRRTIRKGEDKPIPKFKVEQIDLKVTQTADRTHIYNHVDNLSHRIATFFEWVNRTGINTPFQVTRDRNFNARECMVRWKRGKFSLKSLDKNTQTLETAGTSSGVRLDLQSRYRTEDGTTYLNLQLQANGISRRQNRGYSTTIAEAQVPESVVEDIPRYALKALTESLAKRSAIHVGVFNYAPRALTTTKRPRGPHKGRGAGELLEVVTLENESFDGPQYHDELVETNEWDFDEDDFNDDEQGEQRDLDTKQENTYDVIEFPKSLEESLENHGGSDRSDYSQEKENEEANLANTNFVTTNEPDLNQWDSLRSEIHDNDDYSYNWANEEDENGLNLNDWQTQVSSDNKIYEVVENEDLSHHEFKEISDNFGELSNYNHEYLTDNSVATNEDNGVDDVEPNDVFGEDDFSDFEVSWGHQNDPFDDTSIQEDLGGSINNQW
ncbi:unnamed protein product [Orchesella dallaii]